MNREYRNMVMEIEEREDEQMIVKGYASTFNEPYTLYEDEGYTFREEVSERAFDSTDMSDVIMQYDHQGRVFARKSNNTLMVTPDEKGLYIEADLGGTELGRQLYEEIRGGYTNKMSFGFTVSGDEMVTNDTGGHVDVLRTITDIGKLYDVSAVSIPANDSTSISIRSLTDGVICEIEAERLQAEELELAKQRTKTKARILGGKK